MNQPKKSNGNLNSDQSVQDEYQLTIRLLEMLQRTNYELVQENGQRRLTAPEIINGEKQRVKGAEVFVGRIPRDCYEDELMPVLEKVGRLMELRLMLDFSGATRGYAFALYEDSKIARSACEVLDGYEIRPGHRMGVVKSVDNCRLFFGGVPKNKSKQDFKNELGKILDGITDVYLYPSAHDKSLNRGFIFVEFKSHRAAAMARRKLIPGRVILWNHEIAVDWADPEPGDPIDEEIMQSVTALFVRNLALGMPQIKIRDIFQRTTNIPILKLKKINHFAFIHYKSREAAQTVMDIMKRPNGVAEMEGWEICWAKPIGAAKMVERQRRINEAVAKSSITYKMQKYDDDVQNSGNNVTCNVDVNSNNLNDVTSSYVTSLQNFIKEKLNAICYFNCFPSLDVPGVYCKITIVQGNSVLFEYCGPTVHTKENSIISASVNMYEFIAASYQHYAILRENAHAYTGPKLDIDFTNSPFQWNKQINYN